MLQDNYLELKETNSLPRLPLNGRLDLTYRCNNNCRHCWIRIPPDDKEKELSFEEIKYIVDAAKKMGCRSWRISGGEPMFRTDFPEIFDYITGNSVSYSLNTNGTLITPKIAQLMRKKGSKLVALYGATADVHDHITRNPGSFEAAMRGFAYLKEAGAGFTVQLIPMRDSYHQLKDMVTLAESLSKHYRFGVGWLYLSARGDSEKNNEIIRQRLAPKDVMGFDKPNLCYEEWLKNQNQHSPPYRNKNNLVQCISTRGEFYIDAYGQMTFCEFIKDPDLRYDLRKGSFKQCWESFIPSLVDKVKLTKEYQENCGSCELREDCSWCPVFGYLEHQRFEAKIDYLCAMAREYRKCKEAWKKEHCRYYKIAGITIQIESDLPITEKTFHSKFKKFEVAEPGDDKIVIKHHFSLLDLEGKDLGKEVYRKIPWIVYQKGFFWVYLGISPARGDKYLYKVVVFNHDHTCAVIYNDKEEPFLKGGLGSLTLPPTDQILLARVLADKQGCYLHSCGVNLEGKGLLFAGRSKAGKSTIATMLKGNAEILCDDRIIIRRQPEGFKIYGTWNNGDVPEVSANSASLKAILFLEQSLENHLIYLSDKKEITKRLLACLIKPFVTADWWNKTLSLVEKISGEVPCYILQFDKSSRMVEVLKQL